MIEQETSTKIIAKKTGSTHLLIVAGDYSGDMHAAAVCRALRKLVPERMLHITALGGDFTRQEADTFMYDLVALEGFGFFRPLRLIHRMRTLLKKHIQPYCIAQKPSGVILVDFYGFNIHVASCAHQLGIPVVYFISPQVWATRRYRIKTLKNYVKKMLVILPFEDRYYREAGVPVAFIGHPLIDRVPSPKNRILPDDPWQVGILPGSRLSEIRHHLPLMIDTARLIASRRPDTRFFLFIPVRADKQLPHMIDAFLAPCTDIRIEPVREESYERRSMLTGALTASGTATLENALLGIPMVVLYRTSWVTYALARMLITVPYICVVNILLNEEIVPELIQQRASPRAISETMIGILSDSLRYRTMREKLLSVRSMLGTSMAAENAARVIREELHLFA